MTEGASTSARQTLHALGGRHAIDVLDPGVLRLCRFSRYVRRWWRCPSYWREPTRFLQFLDSRLRQGCYDVLLPTHEEVYLLARVRHQLARQVHAALPSFEAIDQVQSKAGFVRLLRRLQLPHPETAIVTRRDEMRRWGQYPCYVKLAHSTAGRGVYRVEDDGQMRCLADRLVAEHLLDSGAEVILQEPATGTLSVVQAVFQHGRLVGAHCQLSLVQGVGGAPVLRTSVAHPHVVRHMQRLGEHLGWHGALFAEYFYDAQTGCVQYIEANPRIGETFNATLSGVDLCSQLLRVALGEPAEPLPPGRTGVRTHQLLTCLLADAARGGGRGRLLRRICEISTGCGQWAGSRDELTRPREDLPSVIPAAAVAAELLCQPRRADAIVQRAVDSYSLPEAPARAIRTLPQSQLQACFSLAATQNGATATG